MKGMGSYQSLQAAADPAQGPGLGTGGTERLMIALESTATMSSDNTSRWLYPLWVHLFGPISPARWAVVHHLIRKTGHFVGYGEFSSLSSMVGGRRFTESRSNIGRSGGGLPFWPCFAPWWSPVSMKPSKFPAEPEESRPHRRMVSISLRSDCLSAGFAFNHLVVLSPPQISRSLIAAAFCCAATARCRWTPLTLATATGNASMGSSPEARGG